MTISPPPDDAQIGNITLKGKHMHVCEAERTTTSLARLRESFPLEETAAANKAVPLSPWSASRAKRVFDVAVVLAFAPLLVPLLLVIAVLVRLSSAGPVLFRQTRIGAHGHPFTILKFRTMHEPAGDTQDGIASGACERITTTGRLLRKLKLDELPQFFNVLCGEMSLVGPRPRIVTQQLGTFACRPGITGAATLAFAQEEILLANIPQNSLAEFYRIHILPAKQLIDNEYMARATMLSDLRILVLTALAPWQSPACAMQSDPVSRGAIKDSRAPLTLHEMSAPVPQD
jgi:lipopolysaccharide/colanic/teichoic acid biosynthesis glycosyltransferase